MKAEILEKSFGDRQVLGPISLTLERGEVLALTGPSGIGKSTLMRIIAGLDRNFSGAVAGTGKVAMVFQEPTLLPWRSVLDNILIAAGCTKQVAEHALERVELKERQQAFPRQLSLGQQRRVALARALAAKPDTLILDEAFASLDEATGNRMRAMVRKILNESEFQTILVTHSLSDAAELADRILLLDGTPASIRLDHSISQPAATRDLQETLADVRRVLQSGSK